MNKEIYRLRIPDDDMPGWIETLHETGLDHMSNYTEMYLTGRREIYQVWD